jgi:hypothetical protein
MNKRAHQGGLRLHRECPEIGLPTRAQEKRTNDLPFPNRIDTGIEFLSDLARQFGAVARS